MINHDLPMVAEDYVHRIGRTGRNGATGEAISLVSPDEADLLRQIQKLLGREIAMEVVPGFEPSRAIRSDAKPVRQRPAQPAPGPQPPPARQAAHRRGPRACAYRPQAAA